MQHTEQTPGDTDMHAEVAAALATSRELGPEYDEHIASGLIDRTKAQQPHDNLRYLVAIRDSKYIRLSVVSGLAFAGLVWGYTGDDGAAFPGHDPWAVVALVAIIALAIRPLASVRKKP
ncbi:hypothetical protein GCM10023405_48670 [Streptomonospora salina]